jgi:D-alanyl-lipoteichoic acid acyltransferase DltB (MBOAT superfamily)
MLFSSQVFVILFLPLALAAYYLAAGHGRPRMWLLIGASFVFYGYWDVRLVPLLAGSICVNWLFARAFGGGKGRFLVAAGVGLNLAVLGLFKYADFFSDSLGAMLGWHHQPWSIVLPLGISFFTFQQISYLVDLRRGQAPLYSFTEFALFISFFPQLIAGPIVRHNEIIHQYALDPRRDGLDERLSRGLVLFVIGFAKKALIADGLARVADPLYAAAGMGESLGLAEAWAAASAFGLQIYFDFSGYSDMAIGLGLLFGFTLPLNFNAPYRADSIRDFWRRWHMTLSRFLRDYLYIPLGGSRHGRARMVAALLLTMLLGGLWHGAAWTFVAWGGIHGAALVVQHAWSARGHRLPRAAAWLLTTLVVFFAWVMFRAEGFAAAADIWWAMVGARGLSATVGVTDAWLIAIAIPIALLLPTSQRIAFDLLRPRRLGAVGVGLAFVYLTMLVGGGENAEFIYFQF